MALSDDYEVVLRGLAAMLADHRDRVEVVEISTSPTMSQEVDVILYDTFGRLPIDDRKLTAVVQRNRAAVVVFSWDDYPESVAHEHRAAAYVHKGVSAEELVTALEAAHAGRAAPREAAGAADRSAEGQHHEIRWPGREHGLSEREAEMLSFIARGMSNRDIAERCFLSPNTVKTHIRHAYAKIGVTRRAQAVVWPCSTASGSEAHRADGPSASRPCGVVHTDSSGPFGMIPEGFRSLCTT